MGKAILCTGKYAGVPYHLNSISANVYCVEELCYLLASNPFMIDMEIMDRNLVRWLEQECGLPELSNQLMALFGKGSQPSVFANTILDYTGFIPQKDRNKIEEVLKSSAGLSDFERWKSQGDYLMKNGRYRLAAREYEKLLRLLPETEKELCPLIYHNMGAAFAKMFQFENAAAYFKKAYELSGREASGIQYLTALREQLREAEYISFIADNGQFYELSLKVESLYRKAGEQFEATEENRMLSALSIFKEEGSQGSESSRRDSYYAEMDRIIGELKEEYRECLAGEKL